MENTEKKLIASDIFDIAMLLSKGWITPETAVEKLYALGNQLRDEVKESC